MVVAGGSSGRLSLQLWVKRWGATRAVLVMGSGPSTAGRGGSLSVSVGSGASGLNGLFSCDRVEALKHSGGMMLVTSGDGTRRAVAEDRHLELQLRSHGSKWACLVSALGRQHRATEDACCLGHAPRLLVEVEPFVVGWERHEWSWRAGAPCSRPGCVCIGRRCVCGRGRGNCIEQWPGQSRVGKRRVWRIKRATGVQLGIIQGGQQRGPEPRHWGRLWRPRWRSSRVCREWNERIWWDAVAGIWAEHGGDWRCHLHRE